MMDDGVHYTKVILVTFPKKYFSRQAKFGPISGKNYKNLIYHNSLSQDLFEFLW